MSASAPSEQRYLLGSADDELARLALQHRLWRADTDAVWDAAGFGAGQAILDLGCGPGFTSVDLAERVGDRGRVTGRDHSAPFLEHLRRLADERGLAQVRAERADVSEPVDPPASLDGIYARWVLCWLPDPLTALRAAHAALKPGGRIAVTDYYHYPPIALVPRSEIFRKGIAAVEAGWRATGGDPDFGVKLPRLAREAGLEVRAQWLVRKDAAPEDDFWQWPTSFFPIFMPMLVDEGHISADDADAFLDLWRERERDPDARFLSPPMIQFVAERPA